MPLLLPAAIMLIPYADLLMAVIRRARKGMSPFAPDRKHLHHRMLDIGHSHRTSVLIMYLWAALFAGSVVWLSIVQTPLIVLVIVTVGAMLALLFVSMPGCARGAGRRPARHRAGRRRRGRGAVGNGIAHRGPRPPARGARARADGPRAGARPPRPPLRPGRPSVPAAASPPGPPDPGLAARPASPPEAAPPRRPRGGIRRPVAGRPEGRTLAWLATPAPAEARAPAVPPVGARALAEAPAPAGPPVAAPRRGASRPWPASPQPSSSPWPPLRRRRPRRGQMGHRGPPRRGRPPRPPSTRPKL